MDLYLIITMPQFEEELCKIYFYLYFSLYSPQTADNLISKVYQEISKLDLFPERYSKISITNNPKFKNLRKLPIDKYVIIYEVDNFLRKVYVLHIFHGRQNYLNYNI